VKRVLITAGPTREPIDPVRFISNYSTGEMGLRLAEAARRAGHRVTLLAGPGWFEPPAGVRLVRFEGFQDLRRKLFREFRKTDVLFMAAAVSDFIPVRKYPVKLKRRARLVLRLEKTPDLLGALERKKRVQQVIGFCLETRALERAARRKLLLKRLDWIIGNRITGKKSPFGSGRTTVYVMPKDGKAFWIRNQKKEKIAEALIKRILS